MTIEEILDTVNNSMRHINIEGCTDVHVDYDKCYINPQEPTKFEVCIIAHKMDDFEEDLKHFNQVIRDLNSECIMWSSVENFTVKSVGGVMPEEYYIAYIESEFAQPLLRGTMNVESKYPRKTWEMKSAE